MSSPLICHKSSTEPVAYYHGQIISAGQYLSDVLQLSKNLPSGSHVLNIASNRYTFMVGLGASIIQNKISLLPSAITADIIEQLGKFSPDFFVISDQAPPLGLTAYIDPTQHIGTATATFDVPLIDDNQTIAYVFTSGSTGRPVPHSKPWRSLVKNIEITSDQLNLPQGCSIIGTTPSQHMYGFESNILLSLLNGAILYDQKPFFPVDIINALNAASSPVALVTTPFHLETLLNAEIDLPQVARVICATAPLTVELAKRTEATMGCELSEIYGSTETGQIAVRRTAKTDKWTLVDGVEISLQEDRFLACGGHLPSPIPLSDALEITGHNSFRLLGRSSDMVNIAGKRTSLSYLNNMLKRIPEIDDAIFFIPSNQNGSQARLALLHTSQSLDNHAIRNALRRYIDPVFLPRFFIQTTAIPRNPTGKVLQSSLDMLFNSSRATK
jgi:acyl-coenzyme A synthetase/AMP-(fatty) acid ligase